jgi:hypothetical protein
MGDRTESNYLEANAYHEGPATVPANSAANVRRLSMAVSSRKTFFFAGNRISLQQS